jgi:hypothetical protein
MSVKAMTWVWDYSQAKGNDRLVLLAIADSADHDGSNAWPAVATLCRKTGLSESTVHRCIRSLVKLGELQVDRQQGGPARMRAEARPNAYTVLMPARSAGYPQGCQPDTGPGVTLTPGGCQPSPEPGATLTPNPSFTRPRQPPRPRAQRGRARSRAQVPGQLVMPLLVGVVSHHQFRGDGQVDTCTHEVEGKQCGLPSGNRRHLAS